MSILSLLILGLLSFDVNAAAGDPIACTGGQGPDVDYGGMTCTVASCDISADPSLGCGVGDTPPPTQPPVDPPPTNAGNAQRCYKVGEVYLFSLTTITTPNYFPITDQGFADFCADTPVGYDPPSTQENLVTDPQGNDLKCYEMDGRDMPLIAPVANSDTVTRLCNLY